MSKKRRHRVHHVKIGLLLLAAALTLMLFLWPQGEYDRLDLSTSHPTPHQLENATLSDVGAATMKNPRFSGEDQHNRRWEIHAEEALQSGLNNGAAEKILLKDVEANAEDGKGRGISFSAGEGEFTSKSSEIELRDNVKIEGMGLTVETGQVKSNLNTRTIFGTGPVSVTTDQGSLEAGNFEILEEGNKIHMGGGVTGRFTPLEKKPTP